MNAILEQEQDLALAGDTGRRSNGSQPPARATGAYREALLANARDGAEIPAEIIRDAWRLPGDVQRDVKTFKERLEARETLDERVPQLEREAEQLRLAARDARDSLGERPIASFATLAELFDAFEHFRERENPNLVSQKKLEAHTATMDARSTKNAAIAMLKRTADPNIAKRQDACRRQITSIRNEIAGRAAIVNIEAKIKRLEAEAEGMSRGKLPERFQNARAAGLANKVYAMLRSELNDAMAMRARRPAALAANARDQERIAGLEREIEALEASKLIAESLAWAE